MSPAESLSKHKRQDVCRKYRTFEQYQHNVHPNMITGMFSFIISLYCQTKQERFLHFRQPCVVVFMKIFYQLVKQHYWLLPNAMTCLSFFVCYCLRTVNPKDRMFKMCFVSHSTHTQIPKELIKTSLGCIKTLFSITTTKTRSHKKAHKGSFADRKLFSKSVRL